MGNRHSSRDDLRLFEGGGGRVATAAWATDTAKTGQSARPGDHRPEAPQTGQRGDTDSPPAKPASGAGEVTTDSGGETPAPQPGRSPSASACEAYREAIEAGLSKGRNAKAIWQDLVDAYGFAGGYQSVKRFIRKFRGKQSPVACAVIETAPGEEVQVDYGTGPMVRDAPSGKY